MKMFQFSHLNKLIVRYLGIEDWFPNEDPSATAMDAMSIEVLESEVALQVTFSSRVDLTDLTLNRIRNTLNAIYSIKAVNNQLVVTFIMQETDHFGIALAHELLPETFNPTAPTAAEAAALIMADRILYDPKFKNRVDLMGYKVCEGEIINADTDSGYQHIWLQSHNEEMIDPVYSYNHRFNLDYRSYSAVRPLEHHVQQRKIPASLLSQCFIDNNIPEEFKYMISG